MKQKLRPARIVRQPSCMVLVAWLGVALASSVAAASKKAGPAWPPPPSPARIRFVQSIAAPRDLGIRRSFWGRAADLVTGESRRASLGKPFGLSVGRNGNLLLADTTAGAVLWFDTVHHNFSRWQSIGPYQLQSPVSVAIDGETFYVVDSALRAVLAFDGKGRLRHALTNGFERPTAVLISREEVFVADAGAHGISVYDPQGRMLRQFGSRGTAPGEFNFPTHLASDAEGRLLVTDSMNARIQLLDRNGKSLGVIGGPGDASGHFGRPKGVAVDSSGHIYVADALFDNIQVFELSGELLLHFGEAGHQAGEFWMPTGVAVGPDNRLYVADTYNRRIQVFEIISQP